MVSWNFGCFFKESSSIRRSLTALNNIICQKNVNLLFWRESWDGNKTHIQKFIASEWDLSNVCHVYTVKRRSGAFHQQNDTNFSYFARKFNHFLAACLSVFVFDLSCMHNKINTLIRNCYWQAQRRISLPDASSICLLSIYNTLCVMTPIANWYRQ